MGPGPPRGRFLYHDAMFTGLIETVGTVHATTPSPAGLRLEVAAPAWSYRASRGDSVAVDGCCLTAVHDATPDGLLTFDAIPETLSKTTVGDFRPGRPVNLEHAATASTLLGGHMVHGHIDGTAEVDRVTTTDGWRVRLHLPDALMPFMTPKGSVCLDGVSLTLAHVDKPASCIEVALIPVTLDKTTLKSWQRGTRVNVEADMMVKAIVDHLRALGMG